jgi:periplasmic copper chaperone A
MILIMQNFIHEHLNRYALCLFLSLSSTYAQALDVPLTKELVSVKDAWVRPSNPGQEIGAAYMTLTSKRDVSLISVEADATQSIEIHNMSMENGVMKMRRLDALPLQAGKTYKLAPGGFHLMLFDLKKPLAVGDQVNFVLTFKKKNNQLFKQNIKATVQAPR